MFLHIEFRMKISTNNNESKLEIMLYDTTTFELKTTMKIIITKRGSESSEYKGILQVDPKLLSPNMNLVFTNTLERSDSSYFSFELTYLSISFSTTELETRSNNGEGVFNIEDATGQLLPEDDTPNEPEIDSVEERRERSLTIDSIIIETAITSNYLNLEQTTKDLYNSDFSEKSVDL